MTSQTLEKLRAYRERDPGFKKAIAETVDAEARVKNDPAEGQAVRSGENGRNCRPKDKLDPK